MRMRLCLEFWKSVRKLYEWFYKFCKNNYYFFIIIINLNLMNDGWYGVLKEVI